MYFLIKRPDKFPGLRAPKGNEAITLQGKVSPKVEIYMNRLEMPAQTGGLGTAEAALLSIS